MLQHFTCFLTVFLIELNIIDTLYRMLRDKDPFVVLNAASALNEMLAGEGGMVVNRNIAHYLLNRFDSFINMSPYICNMLLFRFHEFSEWGQCLLLEILLRYTPENDEELFDVMVR